MQFIVLFMYFLAIITYRMNDSPDNYVRLDNNNGKLYLQSSLVGTTVTSLTYSVTAVYGLLESSAPFVLTITVIDANTHAPVFDSHVYNVQANESLPIGTEILQVHAQDADTPALIYSIALGDKTGRFNIDSLTGKLDV